MMDDRVYVLPKRDMIEHDGEKGDYARTLYPKNACSARSTV